MHADESLPLVCHLPIKALHLCIQCNRVCAGMAVVHWSVTSIAASKFIVSYSVNMHAVARQWRRCGMPYTPAMGVGDQPGGRLHFSSSLWAAFCRAWVWTFPCRTASLPACSHQPLSSRFSSLQQSVVPSCCPQYLHSAYSSDSMRGLGYSSQQHCWG